MDSSLEAVANRIKNSEKKVQLIYAFNGTGKTRLSKKFKDLISPKIPIGVDENEVSKLKISYYNAFTEDLFYWDNDLELDKVPILKIHPNSFTPWILKEEGQHSAIISKFQHYANKNISPNFNSEGTEVTFDYVTGDDKTEKNIKISKAEESNFIWCIFIVFIEQIIEELNYPEVEDRSTDRFNELQYIFIDDPVSSLDDNHLIELAVDLARIIKLCKSQLKFVITTHNALFYNIFYSEMGCREGYFLTHDEAGVFDLIVKKGDSNCSFSYHLHLIGIIKKAIDEKQVEKFHFTLLRNLYEKTSAFLGYPRWADLLPNQRETYFNRIIQFTSHSNISNETMADPNEFEKNTIKYLLDDLLSRYNFYNSEEPK